MTDLGRQDDRLLSVAYSRKDDLLQVCAQPADLAVKGDVIDVGRGVCLVIAVSNGRPLGVLVNNLIANGWRKRIPELAHYICSHLKHVREEVVAEAISSAISQVPKPY
jgi:hypothetical protein